MRGKQIYLRRENERFFHQDLPFFEALSLLSIALKGKRVGIDLFSRSVARQVSSAPHSLTSVFGMGTGGPCAIKTPTRVPLGASFRARLVLID